VWTRQRTTISITLITSDRKMHSRHSSGSESNPNAACSVAPRSGAGRSPSPRAVLSCRRHIPSSAASSVPRARRVRCARPQPAAQAKLVALVQFYENCRKDSAPIYPSSLRGALVSDAVARRPRPSLLPLWLISRCSLRGRRQGRRTTLRRPSDCPAAAVIPPPPPPTKARASTPHAGSTDMRSTIDVRHSNLKAGARLYPECGYLSPNPRFSRSRRRARSFVFAARPGIQQLLC
jgi:hypothetical protein